MKLRFGTKLKTAVLLLTIVVASFGSGSSISGNSETATSVADSFVLDAFAQQGVAATDVELSRDYAPRSLGEGYSPYAQTFRDTKSGTRVMVVSGLPMVKPTGEKIRVGWLGSGNQYTSDVNLFRADVDGVAITVTVLSDQPGGAKEGEQVRWSPQLFLSGVEQPTLSGPAVLPVDPTNENYRLNVLEWDYGICKRRLRIIEGRIRERWVFAADPGGEVRIRHNISGTMKLKLGSAFDAKGYSLQAGVVDDVEIVEAIELATAVYPVEIGASPETFYPDANPESHSVDGIASAAGGEWAWADIISEPGNTSSDSNLYDTAVRIESYSVEDEWVVLSRGIFLFDTSALPNESTIVAATLSLYGRQKNDTLGITPDIAIYSSAPAGVTSLAPGDFDSLGSTAFSTAITYAGWSTAGYNDFALNANGIAAVSLVAASKFGTRSASYDVAPLEPTWSASKQAYFQPYFSEQGAGYKPKLVVTYTTGWGGIVSGVTNPAKIMGVEVVDIQKVMGVE